jgi:hypothetical protein
LDNSYSVKEVHKSRTSITIGKDVLDQMGDILERCPVHAHLIGSASKLIYAQNEAVSLQDIASA